MDNREFVTWAIILNLRVSSATRKNTSMYVQTHSSFQEMLLAAAKIREEEKKNNDNRINLFYAFVEPSQTVNSPDVGCTLVHETTDATAKGQTLH